MNLIEMKVHPRYYGCILLVILSIIVLFFVAYTSTEGFVDGIVPDYCGTAGIGLSDGTRNWIKTMMGAELPAVRLYTKSECNKVKNGVYDSQFSPLLIGGKCYKLKNDMKDKGRGERFADSNIDINYSDKCTGLNALPSPAPTECMIDGAYAGKNNITMVDRGKIIPDNAVRLYTKNECDLLKGEYQTMEQMMAGASSEEKAKAIQVNGKDYGMCLAFQGKNRNMDDLINFSFACTTNAKPTAASKVGDVAKSAVKDWLA